jgi:outer membrane protein insertion porin family
VDTGLIANIDSLTTPGVKDTNYVQQTVRYPGGRYLALFTVEQQFPIAHPLHGVFFFDAGNVWDQRFEIKPDFKAGAGIGFRMEIPLLGNIGFDYGYGFHRDDGPRWVGPVMLGNVNF